jgi:L-ribulose-5-phosphate 3-epimerase
MFKGISDWAFRQVWSGDAIIRNASGMNFDGIEFNLYEHEGDGPITLDSTPTKLRELVRCAADHGMELPTLATSLHSTYSLTSADPKIQRHGENIVLQMIDIATQLGARTILVVPGQVTADVAYDQAYVIAQETLSRLAIRARSAGIVIGIENVWNRFLMSPIEFVRFLDEINNPSLHAYLDIGNARVAGFPEQWVRLLNQRLAGIHVKDIRVAEGGHYGVVPFFTGDVDWLAVIISLHEVQYCGYLMATPSENSILPKRLLQTTAQGLSELTALR